MGPVVPNRKNNMGPVVPNRKNNVGPVVPNRKNNVGPVVPNRKNNVGPVVPNRRNNVGPVVPNRRNNVKPDLSKVKAKFKTDLKSLKKLTPVEVDMFLARVRTAENLNTIFDDARAIDQKRYEQEVQNVEAKAQKAKTEEERKAAQEEQLRLEKEQEAARIKAQKNAARLENEERRAEITRRERAIKNAKTTFSGDLATLKKLSKSERASYLSQVRTIDNINSVFEKARVVNQQRYQQELVNTEAKVQRAKTEQERKLAQAEQRRIEKEQQNAERSAEKKAKALQNQELRVKQRELKLEEQKRRANIQAEERALANTAKLEEQKRRTNIQSREKAFKNAKNSLKRSLTDLKLTPQQTNALVARVKTIENIDEIFEEGRTLSRQRFNQNMANAEAKKQKARNEKERKEAEAEQRRLVKEQENAKIRAQKNAMRMRNLERKIEEETRKANIKNKERTNVVKPEPNKKVSPLNRFRKAINKVKPEPNRKVPNVAKPLNRFKKAVRNVGVVETIKKAGVNARQRKEAVSNLVSNALTTVTTTNVKPLNKVNTAEKRRKLLNKISKYTNKRITGFKGRAGNPFRTAEEYNQINAEVNKMIKLVEEEANTKKKVREGVEFKLKQIKGLTNADVAEFMKKWNTSKNRTIFNQARKRGAGRLAGAAKTEERAKPKKENTFNATAAMNNLNLAPKRNILMKKVKDEVGRFGGRIGKWDPAIKNAKTDTELTNLKKKLNKKVELRREVQGSKIGPLKKRGHLEKVMQLMNNVGQRRRIFEQQLTNLAQNTKKQELSKYIVGLNIPTENKSRYVKQTNKPGANLNLIRRTVDKQVEEKIAKASKSLVAGAIGKIQAKENKEVSNVSKSLVAGAIEKAKKEEAATKIQAAVKGKKNRNAATNKKRTEFTELAKKTQTNFTKNIAAMKNMKNAFKLRGRIEGAIKKNTEAATKIQAAFRGKKGRNAARRAKLNEAPTNPLFEALTPKPPNAPKPGKPSFKAIVQKNKEKRVVNSVKLAAKKTALSRASGSERVKMARNLAPKTQEDVKKVADAVKVFNRQSATSAVNRLKKLTLNEKTMYKGKIGRANTKSEIREIQESAVRVDARKKAEEDKKKEEERKKKADAEAERVRKMKAKKATREAAERAAESAKKMLTETEKMKAKAKENKKFNNKLAEKRRLLREREAKSEPKKRKPKKKQ